MIPFFDHNGVVPAHTGNPTNPAELSPYEVSILQFCEHFANSDARKEILKGLVAFRKKVYDFDFKNCYQWVDGSFLEDVESREGRPPNDIDVVTLYQLNQGSTVDIPSLLMGFSEFTQTDLAKQNYKVDHYPFDIASDPEFTVNYTRYWIQLFSHNREGVWKGICKIPFQSRDLEEQALTFLNA